MQTMVSTNNNTKLAKTLFSATNKATKKENFLLNFMLGGFSACIAKTTVAPSERIKLIL